MKLLSSTLTPALLALAASASARQPAQICPEYIAAGHPCTEPQYSNCPCAQSIPVPSAFTFNFGSAPPDATTTASPQHQTMTIGSGNTMITAPAPTASPSASDSDNTLTSPSSLYLNPHGGNTFITAAAPTEDPDTLSSRTVRVGGNTFITANTPSSLLGALPTSGITITAPGPVITAGNVSASGVPRPTATMPVGGGSGSGSGDEGLEALLSEISNFVNQLLQSLGLGGFFRKRDEVVEERQGVASWFVKL